MEKNNRHKNKNFFFKKYMGKLHLWFGLSVGICVFIVALTGTLYIFKDEVQGLLRKHAIQLKPETLAEQPMSIDALSRIVERSLGDQYPISSVEIALDKNKAYKFSYLEKNKKAWNYFEEFKINKSVYVNQYTGKLLGVYDEKYDFFTLMRYIHWSFLLNSGWGKYVVGIPVVIFIFMLISGLVLWWPHNKKSWKKGFVLDWKNVKTWKRKNYDLHRVLGFYTSFLALIISLSGIYFAFPYVKNTFNLISSGARYLPKEKKIKSAITFSPSNISVFDSSIQEVREHYPHSSRFRMPLNGKDRKGHQLDNIPIVIYEKSGKVGDRNQMVFDKNSGELLLNKPYQQLNLSQRYAHANYDIHTGAYWGLFSKILWFITGLVCTSLPITGFLVWWGRTHKKKK
ncbi:PepSY domain-containing protein [Elizabethkingia argentiflava]|uniref:PepSY domain-containing protein n=1 Tax=Elizabethkingia argenteiflava TaxID=2681556 RepID=A0A845Q0V5_9FLAO|nr:PepSY domain-containing protein [Elizabethkingia argenteiflava]